MKTISVTTTPTIQARLISGKTKLPCTINAVLTVQRTIPIAFFILSILCPNVKV